MKIFSVLAEFVLWELSIVSSLSLYSILVQHACNDHAKKKKAYSPEKVGQQSVNPCLFANFSHNYAKIQNSFE